MTFEIFGKKIIFSKFVVGVLIIIAFTGLLIKGYMLQQSNQLPAGDTSDSYNTNSVVHSTYIHDVKKEQDKKTVENIQVYVTGCVKNPGIVVLEKGQLINDAIKKAGGTTEDADIENINLVYKLKENCMIKIKSKQESKNEHTKNTATNLPSSEVAFSNSGVEVITGNSNAVLWSESGQSSSKNNIININTATQDQFCTLPGIGEATAKKIIDHRTKNGNFKRKESIMDVSGIGESKFNKIKDFITVD